MSRELDRRDPRTLLFLTPESVADALDLHTRLKELEGWIGDRRAEVRAWVHARAEARREEDGAAPTWRLPEGTVVLTAPRPSPRVGDTEQFARWYVENVNHDDAAVPDDGRRTHDFDDYVTATLVPETSVGSFWTFVDRVGRWGEDDELARAALDLYGDTRVRTHWYVSEQLLPGLLDGSVAPQADGRPRLAAGDQAVYDADTGEAVPGVAIDPPAPTNVQFRPTQDYRHAVRAELDGLLGRPQLSG